MVEHLLHTNMSFFFFFFFLFIDLLHKKNDILVCLHFCFLHM